jgi:hypothetical protein
MTPPLPKSRRKKPVEPLDWRELAEGPALRGLAEVLSTPPEVARERASKRAEIDFPALPVASLKSSTVGATPSVVEIPTDIETPSGGLAPSEDRTPTTSQSLPPTEDVFTSVVAQPSEGDTPSVGFLTDSRGLSWVDASGARYEGKRVHKVLLAEHSMSMGEERVYQALWRAGESDGVFVESEQSKTFSLGYDRMARLVRLNEKSVRVLIPKLIAKKVLEVVAPEHSALRIGRTYRIFHGDVILERQRAENLIHVVKNGRAVEFVWQETTTVGVSTTAGQTPRAGRTGAPV